MPVQAAYRNVVDLYARVSTNPQEQLAYSLPDQLKVMEAHAGQLRLDIGTPHQETYSAGTRKRPVLEGILDRVRRGEVGAVMVSRYDRWSRDQIDTAVLLDTFREHGVRLISAAEGLDTAQPFGYEMWHMFGYAAEQTRKMIFSQTMDQRLARAQSGELPDNLPKRIYGYVKNARASKRDAVTYTVVEAEKLVVLEMIAAVLAGETLSGIAAGLQARGEATPSGTPGTVWRSQTVYRIVRSTVYYGVYHWLKRAPTDKALTTFSTSQWAKFKREHEQPIAIVGVFEPFIDKATHEAVLARLALNLKESPRNRQHDYLFARRMTCGICGRLMSPEPVKNQQGRAYNYYRCCSYGHQHDKCGCPMLNAQNLEPAIWDALCDRYVTPLRLRHEMEAKRARMNGDAALREVERLEALAGKATRLAAQVRSLLASADLSEETIAEWSAALRRHERDAKRFAAEAEAERVAVAGEYISETMIEDAVAVFAGEGEGTPAERVDRTLERVGMTRRELIDLIDLRATYHPDRDEIMVVVNDVGAFGVKYRTRWSAINNPIRPFRHTFIVSYQRSPASHSRRRPAQP